MSKLIPCKKPTHFNFIDITGQKYGRLTVDSIAGYKLRSSGYPMYYWNCSCSCGNTKAVTAYDLKIGDIKSCGCFRKEHIRKIATTHGLSNTHVWQVWTNMKARCLNPNSTEYHNYGGRGISIFDEWINSFESFNEYIGIPPSRLHSIDRIDNNGNYEPGNIKWSTNIEQARNRRVMNIHNIAGIYWNKRSNNWQASIGVNTKSTYLGSFTSFFEACCARKSAENKYW